MHNIAPMVGETDKSQKELNRAIFLDLLREVYEQEEIEEKELVMLAKKFNQFSKGKKVVIDKNLSNLDY